MRTWRPCTAAFSDEELAEAVRNAPPGVFDARPWTYWNLKIERYPARPLPERKPG
jgi:hypothetical protein